MKHFFPIWAVATLSAFLSTGSALGAARVTAIDFKGLGENSRLEIETDRPVSYEKQDQTTDKQVVIEIKDAILAVPSLMTPKGPRPIDTSSFRSHFLLISPYGISGENPRVRIVIQLRSPAASEIKQEGNMLTLTIPNPLAGAKKADQEPVAALESTAPLTVSSSATDTPPPPVEPAQPTDTGIDNATSDVALHSSPQKEIDTFLSASSNKRFIGKPITLQVRDADILDVLQLIGDASGFNVIVGEDVRGKVTLSLIDAPWDQALDLILTTRQLGAERNNNVLRITTLANLTAEKQAEIAAKRAAEASAPRITRVFPISYARLTDLQNVFQRFASSTGDQAQTVVQVDERTNSIIVRDTAGNIERMRKLMEILDTQTPQVMIEAKIVEASEGGSSTIGGSLAFGKGGNGSQYFASFNGGTLPIDSNNDPIAGGLLGTGAGVGSQGSGIFGLSPVISFLPGISRINALLSILENDNKVKIVSSPRTVVLNKESSSITSGTPVLVSTSTFNASTGAQIPITTIQSANIGLTVRPTVTNDGGVFMELTIQRDIPFGTNLGIANRTMTTRVLVESGHTLVIGGVYSSESTEDSSGVPILRDLPIVGVLFGSKNKKSSRTELFFFITPRILNEREAGLSG